MLPMDGTGVMQLAVYTTYLSRATLYMETICEELENG